MKGTTLTDTESETLEVLGMREVAELLGVDSRTPHTWRNRQVMPPHDHPSVNGLRAWDRATIIEWAARTGRLPEHLREEAEGLDVPEHRGGRRLRRANMEALVAAGQLEPEALVKPAVEVEA